MLHCSAFTRLLPLEKCSDRKSVWLRIPRRRPGGLRVDLRVDASAIRPVVRECPWPEFPRCCRHYFAPIRRCRECALRAPRTSETLHPARGREPESGGLEQVCQSLPCLLI